MSAAVHFPARHDVDASDFLFKYRCLGRALLRVGKIAGGQLTGTN